MSAKMARGQNSARRQPPGWRDRLRGYALQHRSHCRDSLRRLLAEPMATLMIWSMVGIALALPSGLYLLLDNLKQVSEGWSEGSRRITLYLKIEQSDEMARLLGERLGRDAEIAAVKVIGREAALLEFRQRSKLDDVIDALGSNPLPPLLLITPRADSGGIEPLRALARRLATLPEVEQAQVDTEWLARLLALIELGQRAVLALTLLLAVAVLLIVATTLRLTITNRRREIEVIKLVGGTAAFIRRPFLYTGLWYGLGGGMAALLLTGALLLWLRAPVQELAALYQSSFTPVGLGMHGTTILLLGSALLGVAGAWIAAERQLRSIEPD